MNDEAVCRTALATPGLLNVGSNALAILLTRQIGVPVKTYISVLREQSTLYSGVFSWGRVCNQWGYNVFF